MLQRNEHRRYYVRNYFVFVSLTDSRTRQITDADSAAKASESARVLRIWNDKWMNRVGSVVSSLEDYTPSSRKATVYFLEEIPKLLSEVWTIHYQIILPLIDFYNAVLLRAPWRDTLGTSKLSTRN